MQQWEHKHWLLEREEHHPIVGKEESRWVNIEDLEALGEQGWELVSVVPVHYGGTSVRLHSQFWAFFKRPKHTDIEETTTQEALDRAGPPPSG